LDDPDIETTFLDPREYDELTPSDLAGADAFVSFADLITDASLQGVEDLRVIARMGAGYDNLDLDALTAHGVVAVHAPQGPTESVAQATLGMLIVCAHNLKVYDTVIRESGFRERADHRGFELGNATIGIIGTGLIGSRLIELLEPFDTDVQVHDPYISEERVDELENRLHRLDRLEDLKERLDRLEDSLTTVRDHLNHDADQALPLPRTEYSAPHHDASDALLPVDDNDPGANAQQTDRALATLAAHINQLAAAIEQGDA
jgi:lactate dehydrogenase-like 2-hydroxyacid dehydrogenase